MSVLNQLHIPDSLHNAARKIAEEDHVSIEQFINLAIAEKVAVLNAGNIILQRAKRGDRAAFLKVLANVPDVEPDEEDKLPEAKRLASDN